MADLDEALGILQNKARRAILERLVREPHYPLQLAKQIGKEKEIKKLAGIIKKTKIEPKTANPILKKLKSAEIKEKRSVELLTKRPGVSLKHLMDNKGFGQDVVDQVEINLKYESYILKEKEVVGKMKRLEESKIPDRFNYNKLVSLSAEGKEKLNKIKPKSIGQASRISGVSPSDVSILMVHLRK